MTRKLDVARVFERIWEVYRDQFTLLVPAALVIFVPVAILNGLILTGSAAFALLAGLVGLIGNFLFTGMVVEAARDILDGRRDHTVGSLISSATPVLFPLIGAGLLAAIGIFIGFILLIIPGLILLTWWAVIAPVIVIERAGVMDSFGRSRGLVRGSGWQVFGVIVVLFVIQLVLAGIVNAIFTGISDSFISYSIADLAVRCLIAPLVALAAAVVYFELKAIRGEPVPGSATYTPPAATAQPAQPVQERPPGT
jgi:hypothetical protein